MNERRARLAQLLEDQRERRHIKWVDVARELHMTPQNLTRIRDGKISISDKAASMIERFLLWEPGGMEIFLAGGEPTPLGVPDTPRGRHHTWSPESIDRIRAMPFDEIMEIGRQFKATSGEDAAVLWLAEAWQIKKEQVTLDRTAT
ncbi:hypothetical protein GCM10027258_63170 [Amycolatopsis stemonae]